MKTKDVFFLVILVGILWYGTRPKVVPPKPEPVPVVPTPIPEPRPDPIVDPEFVTLAAFSNRYPEQSVFADVMRHSREGEFGGDRDTNAHETAHGIHAHLRNSHQRSHQKRINAFYCLNDKAVLVEEPKVRKSAVCAFVPPCLHTDRYELYVAGADAWEMQPLYLCDEWVAYVLGGKVMVEDVQQGRHRGSWSDAVSGCLEMSLFTVSLCMAVEKYDPEYFKTNVQFKRFVLWQMNEAKKTYDLGSVMTQFRWDKQDGWLTSLRSDSQCAEMRAFLKAHLNNLWLEDTSKISGADANAYPDRNIRPGCDLLRRSESLLKEVNR